jgi:hypothetical protein
MSITFTDQKKTDVDILELLDTAIDKEQKLYKSRLRLKRRLNVVQYNVLKVCRGVVKKYNLDLNRPSPGTIIIWKGGEKVFKFDLTDSSEAVTTIFVNSSKYIIRTNADCEEFVQALMGHRKDSINHAAKLLARE